jgi:S-adenosylmethionine synthetase
VEERRFFVRSGGERPVSESKPGRNGRPFVFTSESVTEGHPDKVCDFIADSVLDAYIGLDPKAHVACEVLCKSGVVVVAGEITAGKSLDHEKIARDAIRAIGYTDPSESFNADGVSVVQHVSRQAAEINVAVGETDKGLDQGAGDQGLMFGYATDETPDLMPLPIFLAHRLARVMAEDRKSGKTPWLRPDGKTQVSVLYEDGRPVEVKTVLVSTQHAKGTEQPQIAAYVGCDLAPRALGQWGHTGIEYIVNPSGSFEQGGPSADCGVTGRKIIVDTYGGAAHHGGGAFSGKDPSKVDRSAAYFCRHIAREVVKSGIAKRAEIQVAYAIGQAQPVSVKVDTYGTGDSAAAEDFVRRYDFRPAAIIERLELLQPIYRQTTNYGHFGRPGLPWEA